MKDLPLEQTEAERLTRETFIRFSGEAGRIRAATVNEVPRCLKHGYFISPTLPCGACEMGHAPRDWAGVQCLHCRWYGHVNELVAQACPVCDGRVKDLA